MSHPSLFKRFARVFVLGFTIVCLGFGTAVPATQAFLGVGDVGTVNVNSDLPRTVSEQGSRVWSGLASAAIGSLFNAMQLFLGQIAYDAADYIASGGNGQSALFYRKGFLGYLKDVGGAAVGDFVGSLSDSSFFHGIGLNLCQPTNPDVLKNLVQTLGQLGQQSFPTPNIPSLGALGVAGRFDRPRPRCQLQQITQNYSNLYQTMTNGEVLRSVEAAFDSQVNELGTISTIYNRFLDNVQTSLQTASSDRREGQGFSSVTDLISGNIRTPSSVINSATNDFLVKQPSANQTAIVGALLNNAMTLGATQLLSYTASIFVNTLVSKLMKNIFEKGIFKAYGLRTWSTGTNSIDSIAIYGKTDSRNANINLKDISFFKQVSFDALADLQACPEGVARGPWNCTIDQPFATAIAARTDKASISIRSGMENGYLHGDWQLIPEANTRVNTDSTCYSTAYCTGNIKKLRSLRILPAGFEFAANGEANMEMCRQGKCATLKEVVDGFLNCNEQGLLDANHPWCHLIDPNWVIASVPQQCALQGYGDTLLSDKTPIRSEQCADVQTCLRRDDQGNCVGGYGYCMAERTAYRFQADSCPAEYASCRTYTTRGSQSTSLIRYSLDRGQCSADNVGCLWYASQRLATPGRNDDWLATTSTGPRVYFNKNVETCAASEEGCTKLYAATAGVPALNLLINGSFERRDQASSTLQSWVVDQDQLRAPMAQYTSSTSFTGGLAFYANSAGKDLRQQVVLRGGRTYTLSFLARVSDRLSGASTSKFNFVPYRRNATTGDLETFPRTELARYYYTRNSCILLGDSETPAYRFSSGPTTEVIDSLMTLDWRRFECTFVTPPDATAGDFTINGTNILVDAAQLEESEYATDFVDGLNEQLPVVHLKIAPEEFACKGESTDHQVCSNFAQVCQQSEAGCQGYTDVIGGSEVPAILSTADACPAQCVGYSEYRKGASAFDLVRNSDARFDDPTEVSSTAFIPKTGQQCSQADVGCEQFTFMDGPTAGSVGTYNYLRSCEAPDANSETFFTWEGADTTGYQLRTWSLKHDAALGGPRILAKLQADQLNFKEPETCNAALWRTGFDPDCRQFYNANGTTYYRYFSQTVISSSQCTALRYSASNEADCIKTGGEYSAGGQCIYRAFLPESQSCRAQAATCRRYMGQGSGNVQSVLTQNFRDNLDGFTGTTSSEALLVGDSALRVATVPSTSVVATRVTVPTTDVGLYRVTFWAKSPATTTYLALKIQDPLDLPSDQTFGSASVAGTVRVGPEWQRYTVGLFSGVPGASSTALGFIFGGQVGNPFFIDEVQVDRVQDVIYMKAGSWNTPAICDQTREGVRQQGAMLGCRTYKDRAGRSTDAKQFTRLCRETSIGCRAFVDTRNSALAESSTFTRQDVVPVPGYATAATTTRAADQYIYVIDTPDKRCRTENASCRAFGRPNFRPDMQDFSLAQPFKTVYLKDDITRYDQILCKPSELFCEEFTNNGLKDYFRDPQQHQCEYRKAVPLAVGNPYNVPAGNYNGWFQQGLDQPCYPNILLGGNTFGLASAGDGQRVYKGWVGTCPAAQAECTEFRDPNDHTDPVHQDGRPYFLIHNDAIDTTSCNGSVDQAVGCILFRDMGNAETRFSTKASYSKYTQNNLRPVTPVDCNVETDNPNCQDVADRNNANVIIKVKVDRDCAQWLGCKSSETVYDPSASKYRDICTNMALCDAGSGKANDPFCAHYVDRASTSTEPILSVGALFTAPLYSSRTIGLGSLDYSGLSIPNNYQVSDLQMAKVGADGALNTKDHEYTFAQDYRMAAVIPMPAAARISEGVYRHVRPAQPNEAHILDGTALSQYYNKLFLCQQESTGRVGYYRQDDRNSGRTFNCYMAIGGAMRTTSTSDALSFNQLQSSFSSPNPDAQALLRKAFPPSECRVSPEEDSPYSTSYITSWDRSKNPPRPTSVLQGFSRANFCEFGEDCACSYKRAQYGQEAGSKFYGLYSPSVPPGICAGGPRSGQACIPSTIFTLPSAGTAGSNGEPVGDTAQVRAIEGSNSAQTCGPPDAGGKCVPFDSVTLVRGNFGACLERDSSRIIAGDQSMQPCLTWNPNPLLFGQNDPFHYVPTAGYLPPQNSGQYYCLSNARNPKNTRLDASAFLTPVGQITKLSYDDRYTSDGNGVNTGNWAGASLTGGSADGTEAGAQCEDTDQDQDDDGNAEDPQGIRLVNSGIGNQNYAESFFPVNPRSLAGWMFGTSTSNVLAAGDLEQALLERNFAYFNIEPIRNRNGNGRLGCGYQQDWVDNIGSVDYSEMDQVVSADRAWHEGFAQNFNPTLTRGSNESLLRIRDGSGAVSPCFVTPGNGFTEGQNCYIKTWESGYRVPEGAGATGGGAQNLPYFGALVDSQGRRTEASLQYLQTGPVYDRCTAQKPYFGVRAVFQANVTQGAMRGTTPDPIATKTLKDIHDPWHLVGFWVSACGGKSGQMKYIYMSIDVATGDICRELGEVVSRNSHQDAAFTDRVAKSSTFSIPGLGIQYNDRYAPFSSALNVKPAGRDPLFQTGQEITGYSQDDPPSFIAGGVRTYHSDETSPKNKWAYLSNIFARVYRVYRYLDQPVTRTDIACLAGPFKGKLVDTAAAVAAGSTACTNNRAPGCSVNGVCDTGLYDLSLRNEILTGGSSHVCNSLSGLNTGVSCLSSAAQICHQGPLDTSTLNDAGEPTVRNLPCLTQPGWLLGAPDDPRPTYRGKWYNANFYDPISGNPVAGYNEANAAGAPLTQAQAAQNGAFRCPASPDSLRVGLRAPVTEDVVYGGLRDLGFGTAGQYGIYGSYCSAPTDRDLTALTTSPECPLRVIDGAYMSRRVADPVTDDMRMMAKCVSDTDGTSPVGSGQAGHCRVHVPTAVYPLHNDPTSRVLEHDADYMREHPGDSRYYYDASINVEPTQVITVPGFDVDPSDGEHAVCHIDSDCWFTSYNYYDTPGRTSPFYNQIHRTFKDPMSFVSIRSNATLASNAGGLSGFITTNDANAISRTREGTVTSIACERTVTVIGIRVCVGRRAGDGDNEYSVTTGEFGEIDRGPGAEVIGTPVTGGNTYAIGACTTASQAVTSRRNLNLGRCNGGLKDGSVCNTNAHGPANPLSCDSVEPGSQPDIDSQKCGVVENATDHKPVVDCRKVGDASVTSDTDDLDHDNNICTHSEGYFPRLDLCPDPSNEFCGLIAYNAKNKTISLNPGSVSLLPTDVTQGLHTPRFLGLSGAGAPIDSTYSYIAPYAPHPPRLAAPNTAECSSPGQCQISRLDAFTLNGQTEGGISTAAGQYKANLLFYAWADHNQMPLRAVNVDWGDGSVQQLPDARLRNHKPYCNVKQECSEVAGLTCSSDADCPPSAGTCKPVGFCNKNNTRVCHTDNDCGSNDKCDLRTLFGNTVDACEESYFDFSHLYTCGGPTQLPSCSAAPAAPASVPFSVQELVRTSRQPKCFFGAGWDASVVERDEDRPTCTTDLTCAATLRTRTSLPAGITDQGIVDLGVMCVGAAPATTVNTRCSRDPSRLCTPATVTNDCGVGDVCVAGLAPPGGCWDDSVKSCRFTPRVMVQDNWGWCTGECRNQLSAGTLTDNFVPSVTNPLTTPTAKHVYGGCYSGNVLGTDVSVRSNVSGDRPFINECSLLNSSNKNMRPWIVYPGAVNLRGSTNATSNSSSRFVLDPLLTAPLPVGL